MTPQKRCLDLFLSILLVPVLLPCLLIIGLTILVLDGRPVFFLSERMKTPETGFRLMKFRTMESSKHRQGVTGADKASAITRSGRFLRSLRLDELPQIWNVLRGDLSLVGPRPPLREYVNAEPQLYRQVLICRPGITGLATLHFHRHESYILNVCKSAADTHDAYLRRCVPRKARLDLIYQANASICFDLAIILRTFWSITRS